MKIIDYDSKIVSIKEMLATKAPVTKASPNMVVDKARLKVAVQIISSELLKDPVLVSLMSLRNHPTQQSVDSFLTTVKDKIDHATARRYREILDQLFVEEKKNDQIV